MPQISRVGDQNEVGGAIMQGAGTVFCNGIPVGLHVSQISPHAPWDKKIHPPHQSATTTSGSDTVICEGSPVLKVGSGNSCGHSIVQGSPDVYVP